ncbi:GNAT family N-acetyltransferase [Patescibacteria group bacterium]|nr:GNAT family N-acetyltransferase [Patescibacteria group bacterium]
MIIKKITDIKDCQRIWQLFSPKDTLWDLWELVESIYNPKIHSPLFLVGVRGGKETGLLPLWFDKSQKVYYSFGGSICEFRDFWFGPQDFPFYFEKIPTPILINDIDAVSVEQILKVNPDYRKYFFEIDNKYILNFKEINYSLEGFYKRFTPKHRKNLKYDIKKLDSLKYVIKWEKFNHFDLMIQFNKNRFGVESNFEDINNIDELKKLLQFFSDKKWLHTLSVNIDNKVQAIEYAAFYNHTYYVINGGFNHKYKNFGKLVLIEHIKNAMELKADIVDFMVGDSGWKELWNLDKLPCYSLNKD